MYCILYTVLCSVCLYHDHVLLLMHYSILFYIIYNVIIICINEIKALNSFSRATNKLLKTIAPSRLYGLVFYNPFYEIHNRKTKEQLEEWGLGYNSVICTFYPGVFKSWIIRAYLGIKATPLKLILWFVRLHTEKGLILLSLGRKKGWIQSL